MLYSSRLQIDITEQNYKMQLNAACLLYFSLQHNYLKVVLFQFLVGCITLIVVLSSECLKMDMSSTYCFSILY